MASPESRSQSPLMSDAPKAVRELSAAIQGKSPHEVRTVISKRFGPPQRDIGSGLQIEQWDISGGVLTFHPITGPTFFDPKAQRSFRLLQTTNPVHANLLQSYEMATLPDSANNGTRYWLGNLEFGPEMSYAFQDSGQHRNQRSAQAENYFMLHPTGKVAVHYVAPISSHTLLETVPEGATISHLIFTSADGKSQATFSITSSERSRRLEFRGDKPLPFAMDTSWKSLWK